MSIVKDAGPLVIVVTLLFSRIPSVHGTSTHIVARVVSLVRFEPNHGVILVDERNPRRRIKSTAGPGTRTVTALRITAEL